MSARILGWGMLASGAGRVAVIPEVDARARRLPRLERMALAAADRALLGQSVSTRLAVVLGSGYGGLQATAEFLDSLLARGAGFGSPTAFHQSVHHASAGQLSILRDLRGPALTVSSRELSGEAALEVGMRLLESKRADQVLVLAADERTQASDAAYRAFSQEDARRGEGAAALLLDAGEGPLRVSRCTLRSNLAPVLAFAPKTSFLPTLTAALADVESFSPSAASATVHAAEREVAAGRVLFEDAAEFGLHPSAGLLRIVAAVQRLATSPGRCLVHGLALGGGQALVEISHGRA